MTKGRSRTSKSKRHSKKSRVGPSTPKDLVPRAKVSGGDDPVTATTLSSLANMRHEALKAVANNLRA